MMILEQHEDVDIPLCLRFEVGGLLRSFSEKLSADGFLVEQTQKPPGNHVTSWWLYVTFDATARKKSRVQYGETRYDKVNSVPQLWRRAKEKYRRRAVELLRDFVRERATRTAPRTSVAAIPSASPAHPPPSRPPPSPWSCVIADFFGEEEYGAEYLTLPAGDCVEEVDAPEPCQGWAYGKIVSSEGRRSEPGWFPPSFVR